MGFEPLVFLAVLSLWAVGLVPSRFANQRVGLLSGVATASIVFNLVCAVAIGSGQLMSGSLPVAYEPAHWFGFGVGVYCDRLSMCMYALVSFVGWVVLRYADRYLRGEVRQGRFLRWLAFTLAAVCSMVLASNLALFFVAWVLTSFGLHQLLTHYGDRPNAQRVAYKKFVISRLGDVFLIVAIVLIYRVFGTLAYADLFRQMTTSGADFVSNQELACAALMLVLGGLTKSAQFPFHTWLPDTMETPTPVSALMHAGVINAGGYLLIRMSHVVNAFPIAMLTLVILGGLTAVVGAAIMLTQNNVKRALAYSTIAQMGMMMLQCGLGAFASAFFHIIAHSLYKSYAFLTAGTLKKQMVEAISASRVTGERDFLSAALGLLIILTGMSVPFALLVKLGWISLSKISLVFIFSLAIHTLIQQVGKEKQRQGGLFIASILLGAVFFGTTLLTRFYLGDLVPQSGLYKGYTLWIATAFVIGLFLSLWGLQLYIEWSPKHHLAKKLYAHFSNELYLDLIAHRCVSIFKAKPNSVRSLFDTGKGSNV